MARNYRKYDENFKQGAVQLVAQTGKPIAQVARELGVNEGTLGNWCAKARRADDGQAPLTESERAELARLRTENTELRMQRDVLAQYRPATLTLATLPGTPVTQRPLVHPELTGHLRDRLARLDHQAHRTMLEILVELPSYLCHRPTSSKAMPPRYEGKPTAEAIAALTDSLADASSVIRCREIEAAAAVTYFTAWTDTVHVSFARKDLPAVPEHWHRYAQRTSPLQIGHSPAKAAEPVNALLNYAFAIGEAEARIACIGVGLDPGLGFVHTDTKARDSLALDLMEPLRPVIETYVLRLVAERTLSRRDFHETADGNCRLLAPLTHTLAGNATAWASALAPYAEAVAHLIADSTTAPIAKRTPLTQGNKRDVQRRGTKRTPKPGVLAAELPAPRCRHCGGPVATPRARLCPACNTADLPGRAAAQTQARLSKLTQLRDHGHDPTQTRDATARRSDSLRANRAEMSSWRPDVESSSITRDEFIEQVQPALRAQPLSALVTATGLSLSACSRIRSGQLVPHIRHWAALRELVVS